VEQFCLRWRKGPGYGLEADVVHAVATLVVEGGAEHDGSGGHEPDGIWFRGDVACGRKASLRVSEDVDAIAAGVGGVAVGGEVRERGERTVVGIDV
jgi:hypothetical protein